MGPWPSWTSTRRDDVPHGRSHPQPAHRLVVPHLLRRARSRLRWRAADLQGGRGHQLRAEPSRRPGGCGRDRAPPPRGLADVTVIDTSLFVDAQRGREPAKQRLDELLSRPEDLAISAMTILEAHAAPRMSAGW